MQHNEYMYAVVDLKLLLTNTDPMHWTKYICNHGLVTVVKTVMTLLPALPAGF